MRVSILCLSLCIPVCAIAQGNEHTLSPEWKTYLAEKGALRASGTTALTAEYSREKTRECPDAKNNAQNNLCQSAETEKTQKNYEEYVRAIGGLLRLSPPGVRALDASSTPAPDVAKEFDTAESAWSLYREDQCKALSDQYYEGTMSPGAYLGCKQELTQRHMHELEWLYGDLWH